jgi:signal peptidase I
MAKGTLSFLLELLQTVALALAIVLPIRYFIFQPFVVLGHSMEPNFHPKDYLVVDEISYRFREPKRGEVIVFKYPANPKLKYLKRIIGLPGEEVTIENGVVKINGKVLDESFYLPASVQTSGFISIKLDKDEYFVMGDNRDFSSDSRRWGPLPRKLIIGRVILRLFPFNGIKIVEVPAYSFE